MSVVVFVGPTLDEQSVRRELPEALLLGPASCGDVYRATLAGATTLVLIDGHFDQRLAVWHKELLWALNQGLGVYGGASMGALRAAELHVFGMVGVGRIFDWFVSGEIEADDEVAVAHHAAEFGHRPVSEAMVNLRATLESARRANIISTESEAALINLGRGIFYPSRSMRELLAEARRANVDPDELSALRRWCDVDGHRVDQKCIDALALLRRVREDLGSAPLVSRRVPFTFSYTEVWHELTREVANERRETASRSGSAARTSPIEPPSVAQDDWTARILERLQERDPSLAEQLRRDAERRAALLNGTSTHGVDGAAVQNASDELRHQRHLLTREDTLGWLAERQLDVSELTQWMTEELLIQNALGLLGPSVQAQLKRVLQASLHPSVQAAIAELSNPPRTSATTVQRNS